MENFKKGDLVRLKSGGPLMTVLAEKNNNGTVWCGFFDGANFKDVALDPQALRAVEE